MHLIAQSYRDDLPVASLSEHPANPRRGNDTAVAESADVNGFYGAVIVQQSTGYVLAGNTRLRVARAAGADTIPGIVVDCDDETATRILLADNRTSDLATYDTESLTELLTLVNSETDGLLGTGYLESDLAALLAVMAPPDLDDLAGKVGTPTDGDLLVRVTVHISREVADVFAAQLTDNDAYAADRWFRDALGLANDE
jgi:hypothetical protein